KTPRLKTCPNSQPEAHMPSHCFPISSWARWLAVVRALSSPFISTCHVLNRLVGYSMLHLPARSRLSRRRITLTSAASSHVSLISAALVHTAATPSFLSPFPHSAFIAFQSHCAT